MATGVPRAKRRRTGGAAAAADPAEAAAASSLLNGASTAASTSASYPAPSSSSAAMASAAVAHHGGAPSSYAQAHPSGRNGVHPPPHHYQHASAGPRQSNTVREVIDGKEQEVFVLDDDSPPPAQPLGANVNEYGARVYGYDHPHPGGTGPLSTAEHLYRRTMAHAAADPSRSGMVASGSSSSISKGKRKAGGSIPPEAAAKGSAGYGLIEGAGAAPATTSSRTTAKRRKADGGAAASMHDHLLPPVDQPYLTSKSGAGALVDGTTHHHVPAASYRGGYPAASGGSANKAVDYSARQYGYYADVDKGRDSYASTASFGLPPPPTNQPVDDKEGHFIVRKGDNVSARYKIMSQLGQGTFGKVVECWDREKRKFVAIKIIRAIQKYRDASQIEIRVLEALRKNDPMNENKCIHLLDTFNYRNHVCIVSELLGQSVFDFLKENGFKPFPPRHIHSFARQLLKSVAFLHRLNLVHTDLKPENILLVDSKFDTVAATKRAKTKTKRVLVNTEIRLIDFGSATFNDEYHSQVVSTRHYRAPEIILQMGWSFPCDVWSIGCILVEFFTGDALFQTHDNLEHLAMMETVLGPMPDDYRRKAETYRPDLFRSGRLNYPNHETPANSKRFVKAMKKLQDIVSGPAQFSKHNTRFLHLLQRLLTYDATQRIKVAEALNHPYFDLTEDEIPP